jgi:hypothetical protein
MPRDGAHLLGSGLRVLEDVGNKRLERVGLKMNAFAPPFRR